MRMSRYHVFMQPVRCIWYNLEFIYIYSLQTMNIFALRFNGMCHARTFAYFFSIHLKAHVCNYLFWVNYASITLPCSWFNERKKTMKRKIKWIYDARISMRKTCASRASSKLANICIRNIQPKSQPRPFYSKHNSTTSTVYTLKIHFFIENQSITFIFLFHSFALRI